MEMNKLTHQFLFILLSLLFSFSAPSAIAQSLLLNQAGNDSLWDGRFRQAGAGPNNLFSLAADEDYLYAAGRSPAFGGEPLVRGVSRFDGEKWEQIGGDFRCTSCGFGEKRALIKDAQERIYVGGFFEGAENSSGLLVNSQNVIRWDPSVSQWQALGKGVEGLIRSMAIDGDTLYVGGDVTAVYNLTDTIFVDRIARFFLHTQRWDSLPGGGIGNSFLPTMARVEALVVGSNHELVVGGNIDQAGSLTNVNSVASWTPGQGWSNMNGGLPYFINGNPNPSTVQSLAVHPSTGHIYAGGLFGVQSSDTNGVAVWNGSQWSMIPGMDGTHQVRTLYIDSAANQLLVGGNFGFDKVFGPQTNMIGNRIGVLDLTHGGWSSFGKGITLGGGPYSIQKWKGEIYLAGSFTEVDSALVTRNLAKWTGNEWDVLGEGIYSGSYVRAVIQDGDTLYAGGNFGGMGGLRAYSLARWDPANGWQELGGGIYNNIFQPGWIYSLKKVGDTLYIGGDFDHLGDSSQCHNFAALHLPTQSWIKWGTGLSNSPGNAVYAIEIFQNQLVIGGSFSSVDTASIQNLAILNQSGWSQLGQPNQRVYALGNAGDSLLMVGGAFSQVNGSSYNGFAHWNGTQWGTFHQGLFFLSRVRAIEVDPLDGAIYLGGFISRVTQVGGSTLNLKGIAVWKNNQWNNPGDLGFFGITASPEIYALDFDANGILYVGGVFLTVDTLETFRLARRHPTGVWGAFGQGVQPYDSVSRSSNGPLVYGLSAGPEYLYVGGNFSSVGDKQASGIARYKIDPLVVCLAPQAAFTSSSPSLLTVSFMDQTTASSALTWLWDFGDGNSSTLQNPTHTYAFADTFTVTLIVSDSCGFDTTVQSVIVNCPRPQAAFSFTSPSLLTISFLDQTTASSALTWLWDFGDGNSSTLQNPTHTYAFADTFTVSLIVSDSCGFDTTVQSVVVTCPRPQAAFSFTSPSLLTVSFMDQTTASSALTWLWDFGDGNSSTLQNPTHTYAVADTFTVTLIVSDSCGFDTTVQAVIVNCPRPQAAFSFTSPSLLTVSFMDQTTASSALTWLWDFGDGNSSMLQNPTHTYAFADTFTVTLIVSDSCGFDTTVQSVIVTCPRPQAAFSFTSPSLLTVSFLDQTTASSALTWLWDFGDGNSSTLQNPTHTYGFADTFTVTLIVSDSCGFDTTVQSVIVDCPRPQAAFTSSSPSLLTISFLDQTTASSALTWLWDFGDGNSSTLQNPTHTYAFADTFTVTLIVSDSCGFDTTVQLVIVNCPRPQAAFSFTSPSLLTVSFMDQTTASSALSWFWDFDDGNSSTLQNPTHTYAFADTFTVTLIVSDSCGADTAVQSVILITTSVEDLKQPTLLFYPQIVRKEALLEGRNWVPGKYELGIWDVQGKQVLNEKIVISSEQWRRYLDLEGLSSGGYYLKLEGNRSRKSVFFLKGNP